MKNLTKINERVATTLMENVNDRQVYYQYETDQTTPQPQMVSFTTQSQDGKNLSGNYSKNGGLNLNGQGVTSAEDLRIVNAVFTTMLDIINANFSTNMEEQTPSDDENSN